MIKFQRPEGVFEGTFEKEMTFKNVHYLWVKVDGYTYLVTDDKIITD